MKPAKIDRLMQAGSVLLLIFGLLVLTGCTTVEEASKGQKQRQQFLSYDHTIRWGNLEDMYGYVKPGSVQVKRQKGLENFQVMSVEELGPVLEAGDNRVSRRMKIEYVHKDQQVVRTLIDEQLWEYDEEAKQWFLVSPPPVFE